MNLITLNRYKPLSISVSNIKYAHLWVVLILTVFSVFSINQYQYGTYDHEIAIPFLKKYMDTNIYPNDFLIAELPYFYTVFWPALAFIIKTLQISIPIAFFIGYVICIYATFLAMYKIAMELFNKESVAFISLFFLLFSIPTLGDTHTIESLFLTRTVVLPVLLFAIYNFLKERYYTSFFLQGISFIIHPLSTVYVCAILFMASLFTIKDIGVKRLITGIGIVILCASPVLIWKALNPAPDLKTFYADPRWIDLLRLRSSHHVFPFSWPLMDFIQTALFLGGFILTWKYKPKERHHRIIQAVTLCVGLLCLAGVVFTEIFPLAIAIQFQFFRSLPFLVYLAFIYYANYFIITTSLTKPKLSELVLVSVLFISLFYGIYTFKLIGAVVTFIAVLIFYSRKKSELPLLPSMLVLILFISIAGFYLRNFYLRKGFRINDAHPKDWISAQYWAKANTKTDDMFIVAPYLTGFRIHSERSIYGDWKDGTQMFFNPSFGYEWIRRMKVIGYKDGMKVKEMFNYANESNFIQAAKEVKSAKNEVYLVVGDKSKPFNFPVAYKNQRVVIYKIADQPLANR